jgi:hypothetical protein
MLLCCSAMTEDERESFIWEYFEEAETWILPLHENI